MGINEYSNYSNTFTGVRFSDFKFKVNLDWPSSRWNTSGTNTITNNPPFQDDVIPQPSYTSYISPNSSRTVRKPVIIEEKISKSLIQDLRKNAKALETVFNFTPSDPTYSNVSDNNLDYINKSQFQSSSSPDPAGNGLLDGIEKILNIQLEGVSSGEVVTKSELESIAQTLEKRAVYNNYTNHTNYSNTGPGQGYVNINSPIGGAKYTNYYVNHSNGYSNGWWCCHRNHSNNGGNSSYGYLNYIVHYTNYTNSSPGNVSSTYTNNG